MTTTTNKETLPRRAAELEALAKQYETADLTEVIDNATVIDEPMTTISLRVPVALIEDLKREALAHKARHTVYARRLLEQGLHGESENALILRQLTENQNRSYEEIAAALKKIEKALNT